MNKPSFVIDCFPECGSKYKKGYAVVAIDVIRATTTAITAVASGRKCFFAPSIEKAFSLAERMGDPLLVGELGGSMPYGFDLNNSPAEIAQRADTARPMILLSTSGTQLIHNTQECEVSYVACFRNYQAMITQLREHHKHIALLGAGTRGEFREEDQMCCAWIGDGLMKASFEPENSRTFEIINQWRNAPVEACTQGRSAEYLRKSGQIRDLQFIISHLNDLNSVFLVNNDEIIEIPLSRYDEIES
ncbi:MAG: 2-phosphosulfolactate phosphatase [Methanomicrobiales archaeon]|nr:2-phosphosulfolactate phosphatase [Methanomicrobiales archaeon]